MPVVFVWFPSQFQYQQERMWRQICYTRNKQRGMIYIYILNIIELFPLSVRLQNIYFKKNTAIIRWPPLKVTALQV